MKYGRRTTSIARQQAAQQLAEQNESDWTDWLPAGGTAAGALAAAPWTGGVSLAALGTMAGGAALGGQVGSSLEMLAEGPEQPARMGRGALGLAQLAGDKKSAEIIKKILRGWGSNGPAEGQS